MTTSLPLRTIARLLLGATLLVASLSKLGDLQNFHDSLENLPFLGGRWAGVVSIVLPNLELTLSVCFLTGLSSRAIDLATTLLFFCFCLVAAYWLRHGLQRGCACMGSPLELPPAPLRILVRNLALMALTGLLWVGSNTYYDHNGASPKSGSGDNS